MEMATTRCALYAHPEFLVTYDEDVIPEIEVRSFLEGLENTVAEGSHYRAGQTVQVGWTILTLREGPGSQLELLEPDMVSFPIHFVPSIDRTLHHLRIQQYTAESVGLEDLMSFPTMQHSAIICSQPGKDGLFLDRLEPKGHGSGWFIGCHDPEHEHQDPSALGFESLYELGRQFPQLIAFLALPPKTTVALDSAGRLEVSYDGKLLPAKEGSYLKAKYGY